MPVVNHVIVAPRWKWFVRGFAVAILIGGTINALSYFGRSDGLGNLLGTHSDRQEALGFPWKLWERGNAYGGFFVDYAAVTGNLAAGLLLGFVLGCLCIALSGRLNRIGERIEATMNRQPHHRTAPVQFSLRGLLASMAVVAILSALWRSSLAARPEMLAIIYLIGPLVLVTLTLMPAKMVWQQRVVMIVPLTLLFIGAAIGIGNKLPQQVEFDHVLLGIFVCWTPQTVISALSLTTTIFCYHAFLQQGAKENG